MAERAHLSIGEVLSLLREEFPDVTISKIRFLESQGLLDPERTPSGYRKFYDEDVERLRWILRQQREHFLPLKVIKGRLVGQPEVGGPGEYGGANSYGGSTTDDFGDDPPRSSDSAGASNSGRGGSTGGPPPPGGYGPEPRYGRPPAEPGTAAPPRPSLFAGSGSTTSPAAAVTSRAPTSGGGHLGGSALPAPSRPPAVAPAGPEPGPSAANYTIDELAAATGFGEQSIRELAGFGLISSRDVGGTSYYDEEAATIVALAAGFRRHGIDARHLRMYKNAADRESALFEQVVMPLVKQRNPQARQQAATALEELGRLSGELRRALLRQALGKAF